MLEERQMFPDPASNHRSWQFNSKGRALARFAFHFDGAAVQIDDLANNRKAQAGAAFLCGEERLKQAGLRLLIHARAVVLDSDSNALAVG